MTVEVHNKYFKVLLVMSMIFAGLSVMYYFSGLFFIFLVSYLIAYLFEPAVKMLEKQKVKRGFSVVLIWLLILIGLFIVVIPMLFSLKSEISDLQPKISQYSDNVTKTVENLRNKMNKKVDDEGDDLVVKLLGMLDYFDITESNIVDYVIRNFNKMMSRIGSVVKNNIPGIISGFAWIFTVPVIAFYFMLDFKQITTSLREIKYPGSKNLRKILTEIEKEISNFFRGQLLICTIIGILMGFGFFLIGVDFPHLLGLIAGISNLVPYVGVIVSTGIALIFSVLKFGIGLELLFVVIKIGILVVIVQSLEGMFLSPRILSETLDLSPILVMFFLFAGGTFGGILGMFLAIPVLLIIRVLIKNIRLRFV